MIGAEDGIRTRDYSQRILSPWREFSVNRCLYLTIQFLVTEKCPTKLFCASGNGHPDRTPASKTSRVVYKELAPQVGLEPTTLRLTAECSAIELLRNDWRLHSIRYGAEQERFL